MEIKTSNLIYKFYVYLQEKPWISINRHAFPKTLFGLIYSFFKYFFITLPFIAISISFLLYVMVLTPLSLVVMGYTPSDSMEAVRSNFGVMRVFLDASLLIVVAVAFQLNFSEEVRKNPKLLVELKVRDD